MMKHNGIIILFMTMFLATTVPLMAKESQFVGVKNCKKCHKKKKAGNQYGKWKESKHAKAYELLASKEALDKAKEMGLKSHPQKSMECLICHTAGAGLPKARFAKKFKMKEGVQCENCHGAGSKYKKKKVMKKLRKERKAGGNKLAKELGLHYGDEKTCTSQCHQEKRVVNGVTYINPSYQKFDYKERIKEIAHPIP